MGVAALTGEVALCQMSIDKNDNAFTFHTRAASGCGPGPGRKAVAWDRTTGALYVHDFTTSNLIDETQMDKNGDYILAIEITTDRSVVAVDVIRFRDGDAGIHRVVTGPANGYLGDGHSTPGSGVLINEDAGITGWEIRSLASPDTAQNLMQVLRSDGTRNWRYNGHITINHADERYFLAELWVAPVPAPSDLQPWEQEIVAVATDGTWIKRLAHHHSAIELNPDGSHVYDDEPRVSTSYDGKYAMFTSNYDSLGRDVYVLRLPTICN
ncbi:MAG: hypothetical protein E6J90_24890 [Deltaproteobacteria bacterium]|nr:MAG: hypothetical protein E6J91_25445 [Deltaproteobacteria bacterium]TMQ15782.1 MAG: hypothetical protein E6J90_24890 [Deltaproteobacteria bacterium]